MKRPHSLARAPKSHRRPKQRRPEKRVIRETISGPPGYTLIIAAISKAHPLHGKVIGKERIMEAKSRGWPTAEGTCKALLMLLLL